MSIDIQLPNSKSVLARIAVMRAVAGGAVVLCDGCDDVRVIVSALNVILEADDGVVEVDVHQSGTALRLLTAFCATRRGVFEITGDDRLCQRPVKPLVDALRSMGASIAYLQHEGYAPLRISGGGLRGGRVAVDASVSSQFVTALMLVAPSLSGGLIIDLQGKQVSGSYISLTAQLMRDAGVAVECNGSQIVVPQSSYNIENLPITDVDWSAAAVWYAVMSVMCNGDLLLSGLDSRSSQPDVAVAEIFAKLGVVSRQTPKGVVISRSMGNSIVDSDFTIDMSGNPDVVMPLVAALLLKDITFCIKGISTLRLKESDRIAALIAEMGKLGYELQEECGLLVWRGGKSVVNEPVTLDSHNDHRIAFTAAIMSLRHKIEITGAESVVKSYPNFWQEFEKITH